MYSVRRLSALAERSSDGHRPSCTLDLLSKAMDSIKNNKYLLSARIKAASSREKANRVLVAARYDPSGFTNACALGTTNDLLNRSLFVSSQWDGRFTGALYFYLSVFLRPGNRRPFFKRAVQIDRNFYSRPRHFHSFSYRHGTMLRTVR